MKKFKIGDEVFSPTNREWGTILKNIPNNKCEYICEVVFTSGTTKIVQQSEVVHSLYDEKYGESSVATFMSALRIGDMIGDKNEPLGVIAVGSDEGLNIPHFHVFNSRADMKNWRDGACIMIKENRYFDHGKHNGTLTKAQISGMVKCLNKVGNSGLTNWQTLIDAWNRENDDDIPINLPMPDYNYKTIKSYKEG